MKKKFFVVMAAVMLFSATFVYAQNQFQGILDLLNDLLMFIGDLFTLPLFHTPKGAFGFFLFLMWIMIIAILYVATDQINVFRGHDRQRKIVVVVIATMTVIMMNFQRQLMWMIIGNWVIWIYFFAVFGVVGLLIYVAMTNPGMSHWIKALIYFLALMITLAAKDDLVPLLDNLRLAMNEYIIIGPLYYYLKWRQQ